MRRYLAAAPAVLGMCGLSVPAQAQAGRRLVSVNNPESATACVSPASGGHYGAFANSCDYQIQYTFCVEDPDPEAYSAEYECKPGQRTQITQQVGAHDRTAAHNGNAGRVHWFACAHSYRMDAAGPKGIEGDVIFNGTELRGRCANWAWVEAPPKPGADAGPDAVKRGEDAWRAGDRAAAVEAWRAPAAAGNADAQYLLGRAYESGRGVPRNPEEAIRFYRLAAAQGHPAANRMLGLIYFENGRPAEAMVYYERAAAGGDDIAQYHVGLAYLNGDGVPADPARGRKLLELAAAQGNGGAQVELEKRGWRAAPAGQRPAPQRQAVAQAPAPRVGPRASVSGDEPLWAACEPLIMAHRNAWTAFYGDETHLKPMWEERYYASMYYYDLTWGKMTDADIDAQIVWHRNYTEAIRNDSSKSAAQTRAALIGQSMAICLYEAYKVARRTRPLGTSQPPPRPPQ